MNQSQLHVGILFVVHASSSQWIGETDVHCAEQFCLSVLELVQSGELLVGPSRVLLMDEISNGLDSSTTYQIIKCQEKSPTTGMVSKGICSSENISLCQSTRLAYCRDDS